MRIKLPISLKKYDDSFDHPKKYYYDTLFKNAFFIYEQSFMLQQTSFNRITNFYKKSIIKKVVALEAEGIIIV